MVFLGTAGSVPSAHRSPSATLLRRGGDRILVDCGEGTDTAPDPEGLGGRKGVVKARGAN